MNQPDSVLAECYLTIEPVFRSYGKDAQGRPVLDSARVVGVTKNRPERRSRVGTIVTKLALRIDSAAMLPLLPEVEIKISAGEVEAIEAEAVDPGFPIEDEGEQ